MKCNIAERNGIKNSYAMLKIQENTLEMLDLKGVLIDDSDYRL